MKFFNFSIKQKSLLFILLLISILITTLYFQNTTSYRNYLYLLQNSYENSINNQYKSFNENLLNTYQNITLSFKNKNNIEDKVKKDLKILQKYNPYLKDIKITSSSKIKKRNLSMIYINNTLYYKLSFPLENRSYTQAIEYIVDSKVLLSHIKKYDGSEGIVFFKKNKDILIKNSLDKKNEELFSKIENCCKSQEKNLLNIDSKFYVSKLIEIKNISDESLFNIIFLLDVTKEKLKYKSIIKDSMVTSILLFLVAAIIVNYFFSFLIKKINKNEEKLKEINKNLEDRVNNEINERLKVQKLAQDEKEKSEQMLIQQSKLAMMGEMIGNIAHQWRQPLMQLSAIIMYLDAYNEKGKLTKERFQKKIEDGVSIIDYMSKTIEDFRNYYLPEKQKEEFLIKESINSALFIIDSSLKNSFIEVNINYLNEELKIKSFKNEFSQALLNIISNAKDILIQRKIKKPQMNICVYEKDDKCVISIEDNAKGIEEDIINKIFDPYFTTKHKSQGTGIGLYMSKMIIENNINGKIKVENTNIGAKFTIII